MKVWVLLLININDYRWSREPDSFESVPRVSSFELVPFQQIQIVIELPMNCLALYRFYFVSISVNSRLLLLYYTHLWTIKQYFSGNINPENKCLSFTFFYNRNYLPSFKITNIYYIYIYMQMLTLNFKCFLNFIHVKCFLIFYHLFLIIFLSLLFIKIFIFYYIC